MAENAAQLHVLLVEDSETDARLVMRELRKHGLDASHERVESAAEMQAALARRAWQLVISDSSVPRFGVLEALHLAKQFAPTVPFIVVSGTIREEVAVEAMRSGAADFITKENLQRLGPVVERELQRGRVARSSYDELGELLTALRLTLAAAKSLRGDARNERIDAGLAIVEEAVARMRIAAGELESDTSAESGATGQARVSAAVPEPLVALTPRQREVLQLLAEGHSTKQIASRLRLSIKTIETHRGQIMTRLDIHTLAGLVRFAIRAGIVAPEP